MKSRLAAAGILLILSVVAPKSDAQTGPDVPAFMVRNGYQVTLAAEHFGKARHLEIDDHGTLYVTQPQTGTIAALQDKDKDGVYETRTTFLSGFRDVEGLCWHDGWLYCTSTADGSCKRARSTRNDGVADQIEVVLPPGSFPARGGHPYAGILVTDKYIYTTTSDPQNMTDQLPSERKCVWRFDRDGKNRIQFATGIRNTEKIRLRPGTEEIWGLDHGSDNFGKTYGEQKGNMPITDLLPGEELNHLEQDHFYGHPYICNNRIIRPEFANRKDILELAARTTPPEWTFGAHWAPDGFTFLTHDTLTGEAGDLIAAFHGSWNSERKVGYRIDRVLFDPQTGKPYGDQQLVSTLGKDGKEMLGRPVDCVETADGSVLFSDDKMNRIYRLSKVK